jgi:hypothetical protein
MSSLQKTPFFYSKGGNLAFDQKKKEWDVFCRNSSGWSKGKKKQLAVQVPTAGRMHEVFPDPEAVRLGDDR